MIKVYYMSKGLIFNSSFHDNDFISPFFGGIRVVFSEDYCEEWERGLHPVPQVRYLENILLGCVM